MVPGDTNCWKLFSVAVENSKTLGRGRQDQIRVAPEEWTELRLGAVLMLLFLETSKKPSALILENPF